MHFRSFLFATTLLIAPQLLASEFPTGSLQGAGFVVEKGDQKITEKNLYAYNSSANVLKQSDGRYEITINAHMQRTPTTPAKDDKRVDVYQVIWESPTTGKLLNSDDALKDDEASFLITNGQLIIKSWIARNQLWETQVYSLPR